jgi:hypothetical protein
MDINRFNSISIRGRYIYGYLCLLEALNNKQLEPLPVELRNLIYEFVSSNQLDIWHSKVEVIVPSYILDTIDIEEDFLMSNIFLYYKKQPEFFNIILEELFWIGISNLYGSFDNEISLQYLSTIFDILKKENIHFPNFEIVEHCSVLQDRGWGFKTDMENFLPPPLGWK